MTERGRILCISGSIRRASTNTALLRTAQAIAPEGLAVELYGGLDRLPAFDPDLDAAGAQLPAEAVALRAGIRSADALLFCTPEYAGALPGAFKNLLDWTIGDAQPGSIYEKPVAWVNASASPTGAADAHRSLRTVLRYAHASVVEEACVAVPVTRQAVGEDGLLHDPAIRSALLAVLAALSAATELIG